MSSKYEAAIARLRELAESHEQLADGLEKGEVTFTGHPAGREASYARIYRHWASVCGLAAWLLADEVTP